MGKFISHAASANVGILNIFFCKHLCEKATKHILKWPLFVFVVACCKTW